MNDTNTAAVPSRYDWSHKAKGIQTYSKPTAQNLLAIFQLTFVILQNIYCLIIETNKRGWLCFMYSESEFIQLEWIVNVDGGDAVTELVMIDIDTVTITLIKRKYVAADNTFKKFEAAKKVAITIFV